MMPEIDTWDWYVGLIMIAVSVAAIIAAAFDWHYPIIWGL